MKRTCDFYRSLGKEPIVLRKEALGFISNRLSMALYREGVNTEMANRPPEQGRTNEEIARWGDDGLIEILEFLKKI